MTMLKMRPFRGLGYTLPDHIAGTLTPINPKVVETLTRESAGLPTDVFQAIDAASVAAGADGGLPDSAQADKCGCLVQAAAQAAAEMGQALTGPAQAEATAACTQDAVAFESFLEQVGVDTKRCTAWYKQPKNWVIGGAVLAAGGLLLWSRR